MTQGDQGQIVTSFIRLRLGPQDVRYGGRLVAGAKAMEIFGDLATEIGIRTGGDEALSVGYHSVEFLAPLHAGDFVEARARVVRVGNTSRRIEAEIHKVVSADEDGIGIVHDPPILVARATTTIVPSRPHHKVNIERGGAKPKGTRSE